MGDGGKGSKPRPLSVDLQTFDDNWSKIFGKKIGGDFDCHRCYKDNHAMVNKMILCPECGNKRCPRASDHRLECTGSNEPGQPGSVY